MHSDPSETSLSLFSSTIFSLSNRNNQLLNMFSILFTEVAQTVLSKASIKEPKIVLSWSTNLQTRAHLRSSSLQSGLFSFALLSEPLKHLWGTCEFIPMCLFLFSFSLLKIIFLVAQQLGGCLQNHLDDDNLTDRQTDHHRQPHHSHHSSSPSSPQTSSPSSNTQTAAVVSSGAPDFKKSSPVGKLKPLRIRLFNLF